MRIGIIDLGTNSVRFDVHQVRAGGVRSLLHREKLMIRLGQGVFLDGKLDPNAIRRTLQSFTSFKRTATLLHAEKMIAFGTSALREATDADALVDTIRNKTGIDIRVISGEEEAQLIALGILTHERTLKGRFGLIDIGGGSTEISICRGKEVLHSTSFPLGAARLQQVFLKASPPVSNEGANPILKLRRYIKSVVLPKTIFEEWPKVSKVMGSSGTIRAIDRILRKSGYTDGLNRRNLAKLVKMMSTLTTSELKEIPGMEPKRADIILAGAILLEECLDGLGATEVVTTNYSLRDGILDREIKIMSHQKGPGTQFQMQDIFEKAKSLGSSEANLKQSVQLCDELFDRTRRLHRLKPNWKRYLTAAAILHDVGEVITPTHHEQHSYYIARHADFRSMENWESEFISQLCLKHNSGGSLSKKDLAFTEDPEEKEAFPYLLALLRIADALDRGKASRPRIQTIKISKGKVKIQVTGKEVTDLEILRVEQMKALFEAKFKKTLVIEKR